VAFVRGAINVVFGLHLVKANFFALLRCKSGRMWPVVFIFGVIGVMVSLLAFGSVMAQNMSG